MDLRHTTYVRNISLGPRQDIVFLNAIMHLSEHHTCHQNTLECRLHGLSALRRMNAPRANGPHIPCSPLMLANFHRREPTQLSLQGVSFGCPPDESNKSVKLRVKLIFRGSIRFLGNPPPLTVDRAPPVNVADVQRVQMRV